MNLNGPGTSLFQGNELNNFDNLEQREEEEEALEEQRRRDLELKNELENAFDDVSFENDEESLYNGSGNHSSSALSVTHNKPHQEVEPCFFKETAQNRPKNETSILSSCPTEKFNTPLKQTVRSNSGRMADFSADHENFSDECRKKIKNGSLHDIVDQSGGGDQNLQTLLHYNHCFQKTPLGEGICNGLPNSNNSILKPKCTEQAEDGSEQLKILYDVRVREVHRLTELIDSMRNEHEIELAELKHQLALMMTEKERASISHSQAQSLLVDCRQQVEHLVNDVNALENIKKDLETTNRELMMEFDTAKLTIDDLQKKILILEKGSRSKTEAQQYELNFKCLTEKHNMELGNMKKELDNYMRNYETLVKENDELKVRIIQLSQINDENLAKKSEIISRLSQQIEDMQRQCENVMKLSTTEDNFRLQAELKVLKEEKVQLLLKAENLEREKSRLEEELKQFDYLNSVCFVGSNSGANSKFSDLEGLEVGGKLGVELFRALNGQKAKRQEIKDLQAQLDDKNEQILLLIENKKILDKEICNLKEEIAVGLTKLKDNENIISQKQEENMKVQKSLEELQEKYNIFENDLQGKCEALEEENKLLKSQVSALQNQNAETMNNYGEEYLRFRNEGLEKMREETEKYFKLEMLKKDLENENLKKEIEEVKNLYIEMCSAKESSIPQLEKGRSSSGRGSSVDLEEVKKLQKELEKSRHRILELDQTLKQQYEQEVEILNLDIYQLKLQVEKLKKEKDREVAERDKISVENELLKMEIEQVTSDKNLLFLEHEKLLKETEELRVGIVKIKENSKIELKNVAEKHSSELQTLSNKYEIIIKKLKKEIELTVTKAVKCESKYTSPIKNTCLKNAASQGCSPVLIDKSTSPISNQQNKLTGSASEVTIRLLRDISVLTDPEPVRIPKKEVVEIMKKLGAHHEQEIVALENKYSAELAKLEKKFHLEVDKAKEVIIRELRKEHQLELEQLEEKHKMEIENRIEQEKKEAVVDLITEWACEVQSLKVSYAESQAEIEKMKMKYKAAKSIALQYKTYFKNKAEHMKEEWKRIEDGYEKALKELEKNVHILVDVKEDEVKAKVESITKLYEQKINKMKEKLSKCEGRLKGEKERGGKTGEGSKAEFKMEFNKDLERLSVPDGTLYQRINLPQRKKRDEVLSQCKKPLDGKSEVDESEVCSKQEGEGKSVQKKRRQGEREGAELLSGRERTKRGGRLKKMESKRCQKKYGSLSGSLAVGFPDRSPLTLLYSMNYMLYLTNG